MTNPSAELTKPVATIVEYEAGQVSRAKATGRPPVVFVHGLWLVPSRWKFASW